MGACRKSQEGSSPVSCSQDWDPEISTKVPAAIRNPFGKENMLLLKRCALFILIAAAVLLTLDPGRLTWVFQHLQPHSPASQGALHTVQV